MKQKKKQYCWYPGRKIDDVWILIRLCYFSELSFRSLMSHFSNCWKKNACTKPTGLSQHRTHGSVSARTHGSVSPPNLRVCLSTGLQQVHSCDNSLFINLDIRDCISVNQNCPNWPRWYQRFLLRNLENPLMTTEFINHSDSVCLSVLNSTALNNGDSSRMTFFKGVGGWGGVVCKGREVL